MPARDLLYDQQFWDEQRAEMLRVVIPVFRELYVIGAALATQQHAGTRAKQLLPFDLDAVQLASQRFASDHAAAWWDAINATNRAAITNAIATATAEGYDTGWIMGELEPLFGQARAQRIAVTETTRIMGAAAQETYGSAGYGEWEWQTVNDRWVCPICEELRGDVFPISEPFAPSHVGCRCWPVPAGEPSAAQALSNIGLTTP